LSSVIKGIIHTRKEGEKMTPNAVIRVGPLKKLGKIKVLNQTTDVLNKDENVYLTEQEATLLHSQTAFIILNTEGLKNNALHL